jgi:hypothetical protein
MKDISIGIFTQLKSNDKYSSILKTWGTEFDRINVVCGFDSNITNYELEVVLDVDDSYNGLMEKQMRALEYMFHNDPAKWYFVCGDDTFLYKEHAVDMLSQFDSETELYVGGHCGVIKNLLKEEYRNEVKHNYYPSGGPGFFVSNGLMCKIIDDISEIINLWKETCQFKTLDNYLFASDAGFGYAMSQMYDIPITTLCEMKSGGVVNDGFYNFNSDFYPHTNNDIGTIILIEKPISYHYVKIHDMYRLYENKKNLIFR